MRLTMHRFRHRGSIQAVVFRSPRGFPTVPETNEVAFTFDAAALLRDELAEHRQLVEATSAAVGGTFCTALKLVEASVRAGGKLLIFGNGGSAADTQLIAAECVIRYRNDRSAIAAIALTRRGAAAAGS
jgi:SIS domain